MPIFHYEFEVAAPVEAVAAFHHDTRALRRLTPAYVQLHRVDPLADGSISEFTVWFGPIPIRWRALHRDVGPNGFTDIQDAGPLDSWTHTHRFESSGAGSTRVTEHIELRIPAGVARIAGSSLLWLAGAAGPVFLPGLADPARRQRAIVTISISKVSVSPASR